MRTSRGEVARSVGLLLARLAGVLLARSALAGGPVPLVVFDGGYDSGPVHPRAGRGVGGGAEQDQARI